MGQIRKFLPYDEKRVANFLNEKRSEESGDFQALGNFVQMGVEDGRIVGAGVCLHQALLAGVFLKKMIDDGKLLGSVAVFRNHDYDEATAHAWAVYDSGEEAYIIDPANRSVVSVSDPDNWQWRYGLEKG